jgi:hypothetical protein
MVARRTDFMPQITGQDDATMRGVAPLIIAMYKKAGAA